MNKGKFIVIEGGGGSGKTSCIKYLKEELPVEKVLFTREPGGTDVGEEIREILLNKNRESFLNPFEQMLGMELTRSHHVRSVIKPALENGIHVVCDRFSASTHGYQITAGSNSDEKMETLFKKLEEVSVGEHKPDLWIFLDVPPEIGMKRRAGEATNDMFDEKEMSFQKKVYEGTRSFVKEHKHAIVDATKPLEEVKEETLKIVKDGLGL